MAEEPDWTFLTPFHDLLFKDLGNKVRGGPFEGMEIPSRPAWQDASLSTKLFGTYEPELHTVIHMAAKRNPKAVINVGCAEGYYAIGMARLLPDAMVYALDIDFDSLLLVMEYAKRNDAEGRVVCIQGCSEPEGLLVKDAPKGPRLYILDCEGAEYSLIDMERCPILKHSDLIIEYHDFLERGNSEGLINKLVATHAVQKIIQTVSPPMVSLTCQWQFHAHQIVVTDRREPTNGWLVCWAREQQ